MERRHIYYSFITQTIPLSDQSVIISDTSVGFNAYLKSIIQHAYIQWHFIQECWHKLSISKLDMNHNCHFLYSITHYIYVFFWCMLLYFNFFQLNNVGFSLSYILLFTFKISPCLEHKSSTESWRNLSSFLRIFLYDFAFEFLQIWNKYFLGTGNEQWHAALIIMPHSEG